MTAWYARGNCGEYVLTQCEAVINGMMAIEEFKWDMGALGLTDEEIRQVIVDMELV